MSFIDGDSRDQISLLPACLDDYVGLDALVRVMENVVLALVQRRWSWPGQNKRPVYNFLLGRLGVHVISLPDRSGWFLRIHRSNDLARHDPIFGTARGASPEWHFGAPEQAISARLSPRFMVNEVEIQLLMARAGRGLARVLSYQAADDLAAGTLVRVLREFEPPPVPVQLLTHGGFRVPPKFRAFLDHAWEHLHSLPALQVAAVE